MIFIKKHLTKIISAIGILLLVAFGWYFLKTDVGKELLSQLMSQFPFYKFVHDKVTAIIGFSEELPKVVVNDVTRDLIKLFITSMINCLVFRLLSRLFLRIRVPRNQIIAGFKKDYEWLEEGEGSWFYQLKKFVVSIVSSIASVFVCNICLEKIDTLLNAYTGTKKTIASLIALTVFFCAYMILFAFISGTSIEFSLIKTIVFNVIPNLINTFGTNLFMITVYIAATVKGFAVETVVAVILLFLWCALSDWLVDYTQKRVATLNGKGSIQFSSMIATCAIYFVCAMYYYINVMIFKSPEQLHFFEDQYTKILFNLMEMPLVDFIALRESPITLFSSNISVLIGNIYRILLFSSFVCCFKRIVRFKNFILWYIAQCVSLALVIVSFSFSVYAYNNLDSFWFVLIVVIVLLINCLILGKGILSLAIEILLSSIIIVLVATSFYFIPNNLDIQIIVLGMSVLVLFGGWYAVDCFSD